MGPGTKAALRKAQGCPQGMRRPSVDLLHRSEGRGRPCLSRGRGGRPSLAAPGSRARALTRAFYLDGDTTIVELLSTSVTNEGAPFANRYCWVCRFDGDTIVEVRAYLDSLMVDYTILRNELVP